MQVRDERDAAVIQQSQMQTELSSCEKRIAGLEREIESVLGENMYMYLMNLRDRRLYELLNNSSSESKDEAKLIQLQSENQQLKEVIVKLYSKSEQDRQSLEKEVQELSTRLSKSDIRLTFTELQAQLAATPIMSEDDAKLIETLKQETEKTRVNEWEESNIQELLQLDEDLIREYSTVIEGNKQQLDEKEHMLQNIALAFQSVLQEKERLEQEYAYQVVI